MKNDDKKTALKLLEKYADSYNLLEEENKALLREIQDLKANLTINKGIIDGIFNLNSSEEKSAFFLKKMKEELTSLNEKITILTREKEEIKLKLTNSEQILNATIIRLKEENNRLTTKLFIAENNLLEKDSIIESLNRRLEKKHIASSTNNNTKQNSKEIIVIEPTVAINYIHNELLMYKNIYNNLNSYIKEIQLSLNSYTNTNKMLEEEIAKLKEENKNLSILAPIDDETFNYPKTTLIKPLHKENDEYLKTIQTNVAPVKFEGTMIPPKRTKSDNNILTKICTIDNPSLLNMQILKQYENYEKNNKVNTETMIYADDWIDTLKYSGMTQQEFIKYSKNRFLIKLVDAIEFLYKLVLDKNRQIKILQSENGNLNMKNLALNKENIELCQKLLFNINKEKNEDLNIDDRILNMRKNFLPKFETESDSSMINNTSRVKFKENEEVNQSDNNTQLFKVKSNLKVNKIPIHDFNLKNNSNQIVEVTETIESIISSKSILGGNNSFISNAGTDGDAQVIINVEQIIHNN